MGQVSRPEPTQIILRTETAQRPNGGVLSPSVLASADSLPPALRAIAQVTPVQVSQALASRIAVSNSTPPMLDGSLASPEHAKLTTELAKSVVQSIQTVGGQKPMLIPDIAAAVPKPIAPDALPTNVPIRQPIAGELGLKAGQVVQALVALVAIRWRCSWGSISFRYPTT